MSEGDDGDRVIRFPGAAGTGGGEAASAPDEVSGPGSGELGVPGLTADQEKALRIVLGGGSFVCIGIEPTANGADFFTALGGRRRALQDAGPHLPGVIERAYRRHGLS